MTPSGGSRLPPERQLNGSLELGHPDDVTLGVGEHTEDGVRAGAELGHDHLATELLAFASASSTDDTPT